MNIPNSIEHARIEIRDGLNAYQVFSDVPHIGITVIPRVGQINGIVLMVKGLLPEDLVRFLRLSRPQAICLVWQTNRINFKLTYTTIEERGSSIQIVMVLTNVAQITYGKLKIPVLNKGLTAPRA